MALTENIKIAPQTQETVLRGFTISNNPITGIWYASSPEPCVRISIKKLNEEKIVKLTKAQLEEISKAFNLVLCFDEMKGCL